ncbi:two-component system, OmpR family, sensor kinase [Dietzia kunjamensis subsp. schimae]|uniref:histidine kinase n=1 Tax=Dietzia kunjamensis subsp. schimae TaxID=498198 RepID=A0ABY1N0L5_9ACTN|nr:HAMP domain-containing sensor histidine kinase [Dietzia kunjamensis]SMO67122.1 two-component system, OmpR family, sensor kinase [Dietzia kunjamensis subsp. schimae]
MPAEQPPAPTLAARHLPLRVSLVLLAVALTALALVASGVAVTRALDASMLDRTDAALHEAERGWARPLGELPSSPPPPPARAPGPESPPSRFYVQVRDARGAVVVEINDEDYAPAVDALDAGEPATVPSEKDGSAPWRALRFDGPEGETVTVATPLTENHAVVQRLVRLQVGIGAAILVALALAAYLTVRRSLRPLREVERTAAAIAGGDLSRRVPEGDPRTEVGTLAVAVNEMLARIQASMADAARAEDAARDSAAAARQSEAAAVRSEAAMRRFVADAGHDLRTPLTTIRGFAELHRQGAADDTDRLMRRIESEARRMGVLVEDLLTLARMDEQRPIARDRVDLLALAADAVHDARVLAPDRTIGLEVIDGPGTPEVLGDEVRLRQVLGNLVDNALRHTPPGVPMTVRVGTEADVALLEVADAGPGMTADEAARVFERFYRADASRTSSTGGSGLGLAIARSLVEAHGGSVTVETAPGRGATFRVRLPRVRD